MLNKVVKINNLVSFVFFHYTDDKKRKIVKNSEAFLFFIYQMEEYSIAFTAQVHLWGWHPPPLWYVVFRVFFGRYAVRKALVRSTQKFCYIGRRHHFVL